ncbi:NADPH-dependent F420 reductase [Ferroglobus sp.]|uniref:NADPH-dependent F420 reductase n=1 Tax=Ferroglobus sp. TaxID=2614230 RepID=UPI0025BC6086|nr:NADPH-dependent F420 reductase [Ferroglobus sp.]
MKISILGGTGNLGKGLAIRLNLAGFDVFVGSRKEEKAKKLAEEYNEVAEKFGGGGIIGVENEKAAKISDVSIITIPWEHAFETAEKLKNALSEKIVVSPLVPMRFENGFAHYVEIDGSSAAEKLASILSESFVVSAFNNIPAKRFANLEEKFSWDVLVCSDDAKAKKVVMDVVNKIEGLRALDFGELKNSRIVEKLTPMLINLAKINNLKPLGLRFD